MEYAFYKDIETKINNLQIQQKELEDEILNVIGHLERINIQIDNLEKQKNEKNVL